MRVLFLYIPLPIFWALFDQQGSRWTLQATKMNGQLGGFIMKPDQIQVVNPVLIITFIPVFTYFVYPLLDKLRLVRTPLQKMTVGGVLASVSFVVCAIFQMQLEKEAPLAPLANHHHVAYLNGLNCNVAFETNLPFGNATFEPWTIQKFENVDGSLLSSVDMKFTVLPGGSGSQCQPGTYSIVAMNASLSGTDSGLFLISPQLYNSGSPLVPFTNYTNFVSKPDEGGAFMFTMYSLNNLKNGTEFKFGSKNAAAHSLPDGQLGDGYLDRFEVEIRSKTSQFTVGTQVNELELEQGATYLMLVVGDVDSVWSRELFECCTHD